MTVCGESKAATIIKLARVPRSAPFLFNPSAMGMVEQAQPGNKAPKKVALMTDRVPLFMYFPIKSNFAQEFNSAAKAVPAIKKGITLIVKVKNSLKNRINIFYVGVKAFSDFLNGLQNVFIIAKKKPSVIY